MNEKIERLKQLVETNPLRKEIHFLLADTYFAAGNMTEAKKSLKAAIEIDSDYQKAYFMLAEVLAQENKIEEVKELLTIVLKDQVSDKDWLIFFALLFKKNKLYEDALDLLRKAIFLDKTNFKVYEHMADIYFELQDFPKCKQHYRNSMGLNKSNVEVYIKLARAYLVSDEDHKAFEVLKNALLLEKDHPEVHFMLAKLYAVLKMDQEFNREIEILKKLAPHKIEELVDYKV